MAWLVLLLLISPLVKSRNLDSSENVTAEDLQNSSEYTTENSGSTTLGELKTEIKLLSTTGNDILVESTNGCYNCTKSDKETNNGLKSIFPLEVKKTDSEKDKSETPLIQEGNDFEENDTLSEIEGIPSKEERDVEEQILTNPKIEETANEEANLIEEDKITTKLVATATTSEPERGDHFITTFNGETVPLVLNTDSTPDKIESTTPSNGDYLFPEAPINPSSSPTDDYSPYMQDVDSCMSKCCPLGQSLAEDKKTCIKTELEFLPRFQSDRPLPKAVYLEVGLKCKFGRYRLEPLLDSDDEFYILTNGTLFLPYQVPHYSSCKEYCLESFLIDGEAQTLPLICFTPEETPDDSWTDVRRILYSAGCMISVPFLLLTLIVYITCPQLRTTNGKVLCCHISSLAVAYTSLTVVQIAGDTLSHTNCVIVAFTVQFSFLTSFFWLNILCFNTWRRLRYKIRKHKNNHNPVRGRTFLYYSIYGWGAPIGFFMVTLVMDLNPSIPSSYLKPNFGYETCWFQDETSALSYFYAPIALILVANLALFIMSAFHVWTNHKMSTEMAKNNHGKWDVGDVALQVIRNRRKMVFVECLMLFLVMGLNWVWEVVSWRVAGPQQLWFVTDMFNTLQGLIVFYVFVWRDLRAWRHLTKPALCSKCRAARDPADPKRHSTMSFVTTRRRSSIVVDRRSSTPFMDPLIRHTPTPTEDRQQILTTFKNHKSPNKM